MLAIHISVIWNPAGERNPRERDNYLKRDVIMIKWDGDFLHSLKSHPCASILPSAQYTANTVLIRVSFGDILLWESAASIPFADDS